MHQIWRKLTSELDRWAACGLKTRLWVRDDDAHRKSKQLARLHTLARAHSVCIGLAVIPGLLHSDLLEFLASAEQDFYPMCHGWKHINYGTKERPCEFGATRPLSILLNEAQLAYDAFRRYFGRVTVFFVPPYNCIHPALIGDLPRIGFAGISLGPTVLEARLARLPSKVWIPSIIKINQHSEVVRINAQIDLIDWKRRTAREVESVIDQLVGHLRLRRRGVLNSSNPIGILTHHLDHDDQVWALSYELLSCLRQHQSVEFFDLSKALDQLAR